MRQLSASPPGYMQPSLSEGTDTPSQHGTPKAIMKAKPIKLFTKQRSKQQQQSQEVLQKTLSRTHTEHSEQDKVEGRD